MAARAGVGQASSDILLQAEGLVALVERLMANQGALGMPSGDESTMGDAYFEKIREHVRNRSRLAFAGHKRGVMRQRLQGCMEQAGCTTFQEYWVLLQHSPREEERLLDALTTNETFFFRNSEQFRCLKEQILPAIELDRGLAVTRSWGGSGKVSPGSIMRLRILSAGCSTGEEPYSIAMTLLEGLRYPRAWSVEILAGDLSESCLTVARRGWYEEEKLKTISASYRDAYFDDADGGAEVRPEVRQLVRFEKINLHGIMDGAPVPGVGPGDQRFDIIFCRNVMIYFGSSCQQQLVDTLHRLLVPGGYLFTGDAEPLHLFSHEFVPLQETGCLVYQKKKELPDNAEVI